MSGSVIAVQARLQAASPLAIDQFTVFFLLIIRLPVDQLNGDFGHKKSWQVCQPIPIVIAIL
jgi:hypothetical protein